MKLKIYLSGAALVLATAGGCKKDFLDKQPFNQVTPGVAFTTAAGAEKLLAGAYGSMYNDYHIWDYMVNGDVTADNAYAGGDNPANIQIDLFTANSTNGNVSRDWGFLYSNIKNANEVLENVPNISDPVLDQGGRRNQILGEASAIRAYMYFHLVRLWGPVPLVLKTPASLEDMQKPKSPVNEVYAQIIRDLEFALASVRSTAPNKGIVTKGVVNALLAKVHASAPAPDWAKVNQYADAVIGGGYSLFGSFDGLFSGNNKNNSESIWEMQYDGYGGPTGRGNWMPGVIVGTGWKRFCTPTNDLVAAFDAEGDVQRKNASVTFKNAASEGWSDNYWPKANYPYINKYRNDDKTNAYIIRLADIILLKAEAVNELSAGGWAQAKPLVDQVRSRVGLGGTPAASQASMRLAIEKERRLELAFEGHRWFDLLRTGRAIEVMNAQKDGSGNNLNYNVSAQKLLFPIPQNELDRNPNAR
ncbi:RagB/SusD family nutrient uptake outer membrane protein [Pedobacter yulinensis]|uniref:RagB/SusD family nutrient uptake outer membrane protein n=1 Tax=Pedobacter yulinensis TaxID=2126353 RepID=A0A2T3HNU5_9SPHI|nr:RagB/SusD family nutrient uptake outer membrane protein [Pedobacter yulinensis]PST84077.1 RagB/SusD family nutrient uptake outer membrane protein [Pedobacter yulinensis]